MEELLAHRKAALVFYSPFNFIREISEETQLEVVRAARITDKPFFSRPGSDGECRFYFDRLAWDSDYFNLATYKLQVVLYTTTSLNYLTQACQAFVAHLAEIGSQYCFLEIPAEDIFLIQALGITGFKLVETRLTYFQKLDNYHYPERFPVREATEADAESLREVARTMTNYFDRFHADPVFSRQSADEFLATYVDQSMRGFTDVVLVPDYAGEEPGAFLTANYFRDQWPALGVPVSKMVLSAVSSQARKGWYKKLISEMSYYLRDHGAAYAYMNTQATNRAVFHTWESLGYKLGGTTHILSHSVTR
ncbi:MAG: hypothetical protein ACRYFX_06425 [Janthinobacterium lividum]